MYVSDLRISSESFISIFSTYRKKSKSSVTRKKYWNYPKIWIFYNRQMHPKYADGNGKECKLWSDCTFNLIWVYIDCQELSVKKLRIITLRSNSILNFIDHCVRFALKQNTNCSDEAKIFTNVHCLSEIQIHCTRKLYHSFLISCLFFPSPIPLTAISGLILNRYKHLLLLTPISKLFFSEYCNKSFVPSSSWISLPWIIMISILLSGQWEYYFTLTSFVMNQYFTISQSTPWVNQR